MIPYDPAYNKRDRDDFFASREWRELRFLVLKRDGFKCQACGARGGDVRLHVDHIVPVSVDWSKRLDVNNLAVACEDCNLGKGRQTVDYRRQADDAGMVTLTKELMDGLRTNGSFTRMTMRALGLRAQEYRRPWYHTMIGRRITVQQYEDALAGVGKTRAVLAREGHQEPLEVVDGMVHLDRDSIDRLRTNGSFRGSVLRAIGVDSGNLRVGWLQQLYGSWLPSEQYDLALQYAKAKHPSKKKKLSH